MRPSTPPLAAPPPRTSLRAFAATGLAALSLVGLAACGADDSARFRLHRPSWDTLVVTVGSRGAWRQAAPESLLVSVVDARGFVVAEGGAAGEAARADAWRLVIDDAALGSRQPLIAEVCVRRAGRAPGGPSAADAAPGWACEQAPFEASSKRTRARIAGAYPADGDPDRLVLRVRVAAERLRAPGLPPSDAASWAPVPGAARLLARLSVEGRADASVVVPLVAETGGPRSTGAAADTLRLAGQAGYDAYWLALQERLFYGEAARVRVDVLRSGAGPDAAPVATFTRIVAAASEADRRAEVLRLARLGERALARARPDLDAASLASTVSGWRFDRLRRRYQIRLTLAARDTLGRSRTWRGDLWVPERGGPARFAEAPTGDSLRAPLDFSFPLSPPP